MTLTEKRAGLSLAVSAAVFVYLAANMTEGWSIPNQDAGHIWRTWLFVLGFGTIGESAVGAWSAWKRKRGELEDERDANIIARADRLGLLAGFCAINMLIWQVLWQATFSRPIPSSLDVQHLPTLFFVLMSILFLCHAVKQIFIVILGKWS